MLDEVGVILNAPNGEALDEDVARVFQMLMGNLTEKAGAVRGDQRRRSNNSSIIFTVISGSTFVARYVEQKHLSYHLCRLESFTSADCLNTWHLWTRHLQPQFQLSADTNAWLFDVLGQNDAMDEALLDHTDGIPGLLFELLRSACKPHEADTVTLSKVVRQALVEMKRAIGATEIIRALEIFEWIEFAQYGLAPSGDEAPSGPVLREILACIRKWAPIREDYGDVLRNVSRLNLSGSYRATVYQEQILYALAADNSFDWMVLKPAKNRARNPAKNSSNKLKRPKWTMEDHTLALSGAEFVEYSLSGTMCGPFKVGSDRMKNVMAHTAKRDSWIIVFVPKSQIFPSVDFSIGVFTKVMKRTRGGVPATQVDFYHSYVSIDAKHFGVSSNPRSKGHLTLVMSDPPKYFRSTRAANEMADYKDALLGFSNVAECSEVHHSYAVFDPHATDMEKPSRTIVAMRAF